MGKCLGEKKGKLIQCCDELCLPQIPMLKSYTVVPQNMTVFGKKVFKEVIMLKRGHQHGP